MQNAMPSYRALKSALRTIDVRLRNMSDSYLSAAISAQSTREPNSVFALMHATTPGIERQRTDKHVYRRLLSPEISVVAESFCAGRGFISPSKMFPDEHICVNWPFLLDGCGGIVQAVYDRDAPPPDFTNTVSILNSKTPAGYVDQLFYSLMSPIEDADSVFDVRLPYKPNVVLLHCDISGFTKQCHQHGYYTVNRFAGAFNHNYIPRVAQQFGGEIVRLEGDAAWLRFPIENLEQAIEAGRHIRDHFSSFVESFDPALAAAKIKVVLETGELEYQTVDGLSEYSISNAIGPVMTQIREAMKLSPRFSNNLMVGPELCALKPELLKQARPIIQSQFRRMCV